MPLVLDEEVALITIDPVLLWRLEQLEDAGYDTDDAFLLSECADVDLHEAVALLRAGCPSETALRILL